jgi:carbohydrate diacid regulator
LYGLTESKAADKSERIGELLKRAGLPFWMGCSLAVKELSEIPAAFREAEFALRFGDRGGAVISYAGLEPQALVYQSDAGSKRRFADRLLGSLSEQLIETLQVFFDCSLNIQDAAEALYVHRNTMIYRLKRIKELTGYDPQQFKAAAALQMAVWIATERAERT